ncbi:serine-rich adhesin for platelets-like isoform X1 [Littorina saxatilis]|uniref:serine-rich adhesin for platelets-like isoform X1 n=1 Tax=Littorina saxatilis TaxID=31220 RepID=UPI0038B4EF68
MATGAKLMKEISDQFLICKICLEPFKEPKTLSCLHTFCCACVQQQYDTESNRPTRYTLYTRNVTCPLCRKKTDLPTGGVRRLPDNFLVSNLTDVLAKRCVSKVPPCEICHTVRARSNDACSKCLDCDKLLCRACVELHSTTKVTQGHSLIDLEGQKDIECKVHPEETVRFYCEKCETCICVVCTFQEHKDHDVCSFNDGFAKHKVVLEGLLDKSKDRLTGMASRLKVIEKYEKLSKELKERIRDLAISYTSQVRASEKELIKRVDEALGGEVSSLAENKTWLQENFDSLQSAHNLTEIVMKDKGVEMLLLKKEIQGKIDVLLEGALPPEPPDLGQLDLRFVPGEVRLGDVYVPGKDEEEVRELDGEKIMTNGIPRGRLDSGVSSSKVNGEVGIESCKACKDCAERKRKEEEDRVRGIKDGVREKKTATKYIQTKPQESVSLPEGGMGRNGLFTTSASQVSIPPSGSSLSHSPMQTTTSTTTTTVSSRDAATDSNRVMHVQQNENRARGTMTDRQDVRTLKIQTEESCLRDTHLGNAAATGGTYPNTGAAIAKAFLRHKHTDDDVVVTPRQYQAVVKETKNAEVATDISLGLSGGLSESVAALCRAEGGAGGGGTRPDLLAQTAEAPSSLTASSSSSPWIRSRKVQTEISALEETPGSEGGRLLTDEEMNKSLFGSATARTPPVVRSDRANTPTPVSSPLLQRPRAAHAARPATCDAGVMTSFKVKIVQDMVDKETSSEPVSSRGVGVMTSQETRTVYIQTKGPRVTSTATGTDYEGQMTKSTSTLHVTSADAETAMPQVTHETRTTWTEAVVTSERATCTACVPTSNAATLTAQVKTGDFCVQMKPIGVPASTSTTPPRVNHHQSQTYPNLCTRGTMPDPKILRASKTMSFDHSTSPTPPRSLKDFSASTTSAVASVPVGPVVAAPCKVAAVSRSDKATETTPARSVTRASGPNAKMLGSTTTGTDPVQLTQVVDRETCTPTVKTVDEWTHTPQPQMINTGVTPPRPAYLEVGVATTPITLMDQGTYTEVKTMRESGTETYLVVCDSETLTEKTTLCDAQTEAEPSKETVGTGMEEMEFDEGGCMTEEGPPLSPSSKDSESQCQSPEVVSKESNTTRFRRKGKEVQTNFSYVECMLCQHPEKIEQMKASKTFTDTSTDPTPPDTHDVGTMALSCLASPPGLANTGIQTSEVSLYDRGVATSFEFDEDYVPPPRPFLGLESQDAATSTESLPYIGLLSEIDVDELIVFPEAHFELVDYDYEPVPMVDDETWMETLDYAEVGTQTLLAASECAGGCAEQALPLVRPEDDCSKSLVSIGVNTVPKVTFEKETCTPMRHLFSKGTMTFYVAKMDKATSTISNTRALTDGGGGRVVREARPRSVHNKVTMTSRTEQKDMAVETDSTVIDGRITQCISKLRNVSERLNSPTARKNLDGEVFFGQSFQAGKLQKDTGLLSSTASDSPKLSGSPKLPSNNVNVIRVSPPKDRAAEEEQRQLQLKNLLVETDAVLRSKDLSPVRKAQPITTLKPRTPVTPGEVGGYASNSLPRQHSLDRQNKVKMGSQATPASRLPLLRYNSAPGRIATVPAQTLLFKTGQVSPRTSPSRIPVSQAKGPTPVMSTSTASSDSGPDSDTFSTSSSQKVQQRPSLPSISETRTPSSCSDSSFISLESADASSLSLNPASVMTSSHSRTPSNVTSVSDTASDVTQTRNSTAETVSTDLGEGEDDNSSVSSASTTLAIPSPQGNESPRSSSPAKKEKKEKKGFMQRLLSGGKKKQKDSGDKESAAKPTAGDSAQKQTQKLQTPPPPSPKVQPKQAKPPTAQGQGAKPKQPQKSSAASSSSSQAAAKPPPPVSSPASSRPASSDSTKSGTSSTTASTASGTAAASSVPPMAPHHYPPLPEPAPPRRPQPFVIIQHRVMSIQQDNVETLKEKKEREKEREEKREERKEEKKAAIEDKKQAEKEKEEKEKAADCVIS